MQFRNQRRIWPEALRPSLQRRSPVSLHPPSAGAKAPAVICQGLRWKGAAFRFLFGFQDRVTVNGERPGLVLEVEDDGPEIPENLYTLISQRGVRGDQNVAGHGIGLAAVREIVEQVYGGTLEFGRAERGGALVRVRL